MDYSTKSRVSTQDFGIYVYMYVVVSKHMLPLQFNKPINFENFLVSAVK